jgi:hypothetical protein
MAYENDVQAFVGGPPGDEAEILSKLDELLTCVSID